MIIFALDKLLQPFLYVVQKKSMNFLCKQVTSFFRRYIGLIAM